MMITTTRECTVHRTWIATLLAGVTLLAGATPTAARAGGATDEWAQAAAHATNDHFNPGETRLTSKNAAKLKPRWTVPHAEATCAGPSTPLVGGGKLLTAEAYRISAYNARTGAVSWQTAVNGRRQIVLATVVGNRLVAQYRDCRRNKAFLTALDVRTGKTLYTRPIGTTLMYGLVADKGVLAGGLWEDDAARYAMRGYRLTDGALLWSRPGTMHFPPVSARGRLVAEGGAVDITTGKQKWALPAGCFDVLGASPDGSRLFQSCDAGGIRVIDAATGTVVTTHAGEWSRYSFATDGPRIYLRGDTEVGALDAKTGRLLWSAAFADNAPVELAVAGGVLYGRRGNGHPLVAYKVTDGTPITLAAATAAAEGSPMIAQGRLYATTGATITAYAP